MINKPKVVIDTNIFIRSWFDDYKSCDKILTLIDDRKLKLLFSQDTIGELVYVTKNFARYNISNIQDRVQVLQSIMELFYYGISINTLNSEHAKLNDIYDDMFLECAIEGDADYLISDDFKSGMHYVDGLNLKVLSSEEFIQVFNNKVEYILPVELTEKVLLNSEEISVNNN